MQPQAPPQQSAIAITTRKKASAGLIAGLHPLPLSVRRGHADYNVALRSTAAKPLFAAKAQLR